MRVRWGFCLFNNAAIVAKYCLDSVGMKRVFSGWDLHHGNGTQGDGDPASSFAHFTSSDPSFTRKRAI